MWVLEEDMTHDRIDQRLSGSKHQDMIKSHAEFYLIGGVSILYTLDLRQPAARASASEQNQRSPCDALMRVSS